ncbi:MAG: metallophosphoesterase [Clostridia bacterium]|nr:metallophosphoesterase [Clostridia bacterium]
MIYVMSDLHGCFDKYQAMLEKIRFGKDDLMYILGDIVDRGEDGIKILLDMIKRPNIVPILGNHEYMAYTVLEKMNVEITQDNYDNHLDTVSLRNYDNWMFNGGETTLNGFLSLNKASRKRILEYFEEFSLYEELEVNNNSFVLVHGGLVNFDENKPLSEYELYDLVWGRCDYARTYFKDKYLITGHTPTALIDEKCRGKIYKENNHIAIDCGVVFNIALGCICLDTMEEFYV